MPELTELVGAVDVYLVDQVLRGRVPAGSSVLDVGCGAGRNLTWFLRAGHPVRGIDLDPMAVERAREVARALRPDLCADAFQVADLADWRCPDPAHLVICNAVLHFARDAEHFGRLLHGAWGAVAPGGLLFCRLASSIGLEGRAVPLTGGRHLLPDGSERFLVDRADLSRWTSELGAVLLDPVKTTLVEDLRAMTTWVVGRPLSRTAPAAAP